MINHRVTHRMQRSYNVGPQPNDGLGWFMKPMNHKAHSEIGVMFTNLAFTKSPVGVIVCFFLKAKLDYGMVFSSGDHGGTEKSPC